MKGKVTAHAIDIKVLKLLSKQDWGDINPILIDYTKYLVRSCGHNHLPKGLEIRDLVSEAITDTWTGKRIWNPEKVPDIIHFLKAVVRSKVSHLWELEEYKTTKSRGLLSKTEELEYESKSIDGERRIIEEIYVKQVKEYLYSCAEKDDEMKSVVECLNEVMTRREISSETGFEVSKVYNIMKRIRRAYEKFLESH